MDIEFDLDSAWPVFICDTVQKYFQQAYGRLDQTGCPYAFRGVTHRYPNLRPSIDRREIARDDPVEVETQLLKEFLLRAWDHLTHQERKRCLLAEKRWNDKRNTGSMVVARHRMVPTRCIDWTYDPLISLFFACEADHDREGEVWWFNRREFNHCVGAQWPALFGKPAHVEKEIEQDFIDRCETEWFTALDYMLLPDDRLDRQRAWITVSGRLRTCHADKIHSLGVGDAGRLVIPAQLKFEAMAFLGQMGITRKSLLLAHDEPTDRIAAQIGKDFEERFPAKIYPPSTP